jgi:hypothetical protein
MHICHRKKTVSVSTSSSVIVAFNFAIIRDCILRSVVPGALAGLSRSMGYMKRDNRLTGGLLGVTVVATVA